LLLLTGDIGGTNARLALARAEGDSFAIEAVRVYPSAESGSLIEVLERYRSDEPAAQGVTAMGLGVAGPVHRQTCRVTNLPWHIDAAEVAASFGTPVRLVNDFEAVGFALPGLPESGLVTLQQGEREPDAPMALLGAGTGLGEALVLPGRGGTRVVPGEGGHADFAPQTPDDTALLAFLRARHGGHVSWERVLSGAGLAAVHAFHAGAAPEADTVDPAEITAGALAGDPRCGAAVAHFLALYGAEAGNHALRSVARGGVYLAGGIAPRLLDRLREPEGPFLCAFRDKGRFASLMGGLSVQVVVDPWVALRGAAAAAASA
jgi:glucokinase